MGFIYICNDSTFVIQLPWLIYNAIIHVQIFTYKIFLPDIKPFDNTY